MCSVSDVGFGSGKGAVFGVQCKICEEVLWGGLVWFLGGIGGRVVVWVGVGWALLLGEFFCLFWCVVLVGRGGACLILFAFFPVKAVVGRGDWVIVGLWLRLGVVVGCLVCFWIGLGNCLVECIVFVVFWSCGRFFCGVFLFLLWSCLVFVLVFLVVG